ncbi:hypothetical protein ACK6TD_19500 [Enterobacter hormaechei]|uniref:hypothetical protein n=1 Tax=Enterobacter hormaechei TaxID=158836 RepID=UPI003C2EECDB
MIELRKHLILTTLTILLFTSHCYANVYVCEKDQYGPQISDRQLNMESHDDSKTKVREALNNPNDTRIVNGVQNQYGWDLCIKPDLWHLGGSGPKYQNHITAYVYKDDVYKTTCHIFSHRKELYGPYVTSCSTETE